MRHLLLLIPLALVACTPDPIEACVEAHKRRAFSDCERIWAEKNDSCDGRKKERIVVQLEPDWRERCMDAAGGKRLTNQHQ